MIHVFGECELDEARFELRRRGAVIKLEPKTFDLLAYLIRSSDRVVSKDELLDAVWPGQVVSESVLPKCVAAARRALGDGPAGRRLIQTVHGRGYRFAAPVQTRAPTIPETPADRAAPLVPPFVGHTHAMQRLHAAFELALAGHGRLVLLAGEPGIGKTRTAEELAAEARRRHALVLVGRAHEGEGAPAFWPWVQILRASAPAGPAPRVDARRTDAAAVAELVRELGGEAASTARATAVEAEQARFRLFDGVTAFLRRLAERQPLVVVLDDLHWADDASLRLLGFLARELSDARLLVVATYRDVEVRRGHPLADLLGLVSREPSSERVPLRGFSPAETARLVASLAGGAVADELVAAVHDMTEGNPFFIQEVVRLLVSAGSLANRPEVAVPLALPQSVRDAIGRRLDALSAPCNEVLRVAAVLGREFSAPLLAQTAGLPNDRILALLAEAVQARALDEDAAPGRYRFHHSLIRQTLYEELSTPERVRLHGRAAAALEAACGADVGPVLDELAHHAVQGAAAGDATKAVDLCLRAGARALGQLAYEQGARHYERALELLELHGSPDAARRAEVLLALGEAHALAGARERGHGAFARAVQIGRQLARPDLLARAALGYRGPHEMGTPPEPDVLALLEEARTGLGDDSPALRARLLSRLAGTPPHSDSMQTREELSREALALARRADEAMALRDALQARLWACLGPDHLDDRLAVARELLDLAERQRSPHMALLAHDVRFGVHLIRGHIAAADQALSAYAEVAEALREPVFLFFATFYHGSRALARGELDAAEQLFRTALARGRGTVPYAHFMCTAQLYVIVYLRGEQDDPELNRVFWGEMMALPYSWEPAMRAAFALSLYVRGERAAARREFEALVARGIETLRRDEHWLVTMGSLSTVAVLLGDRGTAARLYDLLLPYGELVLVHDLLRSTGGTIAAALGSLATLLGRYEDAESHFERARVKGETMGGLAAFEEGPGYARLLLLRDRPGDRARAEAMLAEARRRMAAVGIQLNWQLLALEELGLIPAPPAPDAPGSAAPPPRRRQRIANKPSRNRQDSRRG